GDRCSPEHVPEVDRMRLEQLDVSAQVRAQIAARPEWDHERLHPPDRKRDDEDDPDCPPRLRERYRASGESEPGLAERAHGATDYLGPSRYAGILSRPWRRPDRRSRWSSRA